MSRETMRLIQSQMKNKRLSELHSENSSPTRVYYATKSELEAVKDSLANTESYLNKMIENTSSSNGKIDVRFPNQRSVSIPVPIDQGGTGATTLAQAQINLGIINTGITRTIVVTSGNVTAGSTSSVDYVYLVSGAHTITLPTAVSNTNRYSIKNNHSANITIDTTSAQTIDGTTSISIAPEESVDIISTNTNWSIL